MLCLSVAARMLQACQAMHDAAVDAVAVSEAVSPAWYRHTHGTRLHKCAAWHQAVQMYAISAEAAVLMQGLGLQAPPVLWARLTGLQLLLLRLQRSICSHQPCICATDDHAQHAISIDAGPTVLL